ncbi:MAG TPA: hypothetical protein PK357_01620 [Candidatus Pacearchaeota archaeon]|nr:hypothetical protein [Candidatus Pacearchaeota archaeon]
MKYGKNPHEILIEKFLNNESTQDFLFGGDFCKYFVNDLIFYEDSPNNKSKHQLLKSLLKNSEIQDKFSFVDMNAPFDYTEKLNLKKEKIWEHEEILQDCINFHDAICLLDEKERELGYICSKFNSTKEKILSKIERYYFFQLRILNILGANISEYPKNLEDLTK